MSYTRRVVIRDAAVLSLAGVSGFSPFLTGCHGSRFADGIRIFFEGAWLFCAHPTDPSQMFAVTLNPTKCVVPLPECQQVQPPNPDPSTLKHIFPYGIWDEIPDWDERHTQTQLTPTPCAQCSPGQACSMPVPHRVYVLGNWSKSCKDVDALFKDADTRSRFTYFLNQGRPSCTVVWNTPELRVISLPLPNRIIPAAFRVGADIDDPDGLLNKHGGSSDTGIATTHIFDYPGARSMLFVPLAGEPVEMSKGRKYKSDFHFHTVPASANNLPKCHDVMMFAALTGLVGQTSNLVLHPDYCNKKLSKGASVPDSVKEGELEMDMSSGVGPCLSGRDMNVVSINLATCGSGGLGVGGGH